MTWTAEKLFKAILEFISMTPNEDEWNDASLMNNQPRLIRFQRIESLLNAFELTRREIPAKKSIWKDFLFQSNENNREAKNRIQFFLRGEFINHRELADYNSLIPLIEENSNSSTERAVDLHDISRLFQHLLSYRISATNVLAHNNGVLEASSRGFQTAIRITAEANNVIYEHVQQLDEILFQIIDPWRREIDEQELVNKYKFPTADLNQIDFDNY